MVLPRRIGCKLENVKTFDGIVDLRLSSYSGPEARATPVAHMEACPQRVGR